MSAETLLSRLTKVRKMGSDRWMACCPAHQDKTPSLSVRECSDGRVLLHCWTGCSVESILDAVGLEFDALFPEQLDIQHAPRERMPFSHREAMAALVPEVILVAHASSLIQQGKQLTTADHERVMVATVRLNAAHAYVEGL
jgi:hypothetical protein